MSDNLFGKKIFEYESIIHEKFSERIQNIYCKNFNEIHILTISPEDSNEVSYFIHDKLRCGLVTVICTDERNIENTIDWKDKSVNSKQTINFNKNWQYGFSLRLIFSSETDDIFFIVTTFLPNVDNPAYPSNVVRIPSAIYYEKEIFDMFGIIAQGNPDTRKLVLHERWPDNQFPLRRDFNIKTKNKIRLNKPYKFLKVEGEGICEIPVGPVHAGIIEPGHFRFSIYGENILNLETRLYYTHKGIEKLAETMTLDEALLLSERISGDESVANSMAYCQATERMASIQIPKKAAQIRTICAELERIWNHLGTVAGMCTDVGFAYGSSRINILKEKIMRINEKLSGSRLLFGVNKIGGVKIDFKPETLGLILADLSQILQDFDNLVKSLHNTSSFMDRLKGTGIISSQDVQALGANGVIARCVGIDIDTRKNHPYAYYQYIDLENIQGIVDKIAYEVELKKRKGDVLSRFEVRVVEITHSVHIIKKIATDILDKSTKQELHNTPQTQNDEGLVIDNLKNHLQPYDSALGYSESHRGQTIHWVMLGKDSNKIFRYKIRTASFCNWPLIELAVQNNIIPDFPLINKSFDLSYSGNDL
ncbi:MAG: NADH-quinone oxidoreductase subunit C [Candidatus Nitrosocosmicus sp.]|nr:NADH-quinone oxidoreductase subunit C [Candidatus Nitrosocosmicus sp.]